MMKIQEGTSGDFTGNRRISIMKFKGGLLAVWQESGQQAGLDQQAGHPSTRNSFWKTM